MINISDMYKIYRMGDNDINALNGIDTPTSGEYFIDGLKVNGLNDSQLADIRNKKIGFIFQGFNLLQKLSALENVELPLVYQGAPAKERYERSLRALKAVGLEDRIHHKPSELSGGQQQRVAIARALASDPPLILADEPTGNLDSKSGKEIMALLHELHGKGNTIVLITHDNGIAMQAKRVVRIQDGMITEDRKVV
ncbi:MAG: ABC-type antimicrobial peptide transport system, ATPase component [Clostridia bacterium]|nr:ABC-type antimicrobial peptide transport system, ATPase component [Clostridia bacterium]